MMRKDELLFPTLDAAQLGALRAYGDESTYADGDMLFTEGDAADTLFIVLAGKVKVVRKAGRETATLAVHEPGQFAGELSLMAGQQNIASGIALGEVRALCLTVEAMERAFRDHADIKELMLTAMSKRRPEADAQLLQREKMAALGKMSAGLAHELNNPAAAISRASAQLKHVITRQLTQSIRLAGCAADAQDAGGIVERLLHRTSAASSEQQTQSALERSDLEEALADWLDEQKAADAWTIAPDLVTAGIGKDELGDIAKTVPSASLGDLAAWVASAAGSLSLVGQIESSAERLSEVIGAIKSYTFMDKAPVQQVNVAAGLESTLTLLRHKMRGIAVMRDYQPNLPIVTGRGGELNQVWTNLIDNAVDAMDGAGTLKIATRSDGTQVTVEISDTGCGIDPEVKTHIFEPFYTTKEIGKGTGLGLDTVYRIVVDEHHGEISVQSAPGATTFTVRLPISAAS